MILRTRKIFSFLLVTLLFTSMTLTPVIVFAKGVWRPLRRLPYQQQTLDVPLEEQVVVVYRDTPALEAGIEPALEPEVVEHVTAAIEVTPRVNTVAVDAEVTPQELAAELERDPRVLVAVPNTALRTFDLPNDPAFTSTANSAISLTSATTYTGTKFPAAWHYQALGLESVWQTVANASPVVVAVIDTGVDPDCSELQGRLVPGRNYATGNTALTGTKKLFDPDGHGTAVANCVVGRANNADASAGTAGAANVKVKSYGIDGCTGRTDADHPTNGNADLRLDYACAAILDASKDSQVRVINLSLGGEGTSLKQLFAPLVAEAHERGKVVVAAAGNSGALAEDMYPASNNGVISVGAIGYGYSTLPAAGTQATSTEITERATQPTYAWSTFSHYNSRVDLSAPGEKIYLDYYKPRTNTYTKGTLVDGTSFASPFVAGCAALLIARQPLISADQVEQILVATAKDLTFWRTASNYKVGGVNYGGKDARLVGRDPYYGAGLPQMAAALDLLALTPPDTRVNLWLASIATIPTQIYTGKVRKPRVVVIAPNTHTTLINDRDYTLTYSKNTAIGTATVTITGKGAYRGTKTATFKIIPKKTSIKRLSSAARRVKVTWKKVPGVSKYQLRYRVRGKGWKAVTLSAKKMTYRLSKLPKKITCKVQVRSYKSVAGIKYASAWSKTKTIRVK